MEDSTEWINAVLLNFLECHPPLLYSFIIPATQNDRNLHFFIRCAAGRLGHMLGMVPRTSRRHTYGFLYLSARDDSLDSRDPILHFLTALFVPSPLIMIIIRNRSFLSSS